MKKYLVEDKKDHSYTIIAAETVTDARAKWAKKTGRPANSATVHQIEKRKQPAKGTPPEAEVVSDGILG